MTFYAALGAIEQGCVYGIMVIGVYLTFRILDFPDQDVEHAMVPRAHVDTIGPLSPARHEHLIRLAYTRRRPKKDLEVAARLPLRTFQQRVRRWTALLSYWVVRHLMTPDQRSGRLL